VTRRRGLIATGIATVVLLVAMSPAEERMKDTGGPGLGETTLLGHAIAGVLAGIRPARRAARLDVLQAIATE